MLTQRQSVAEHQARLFTIEGRVQGVGFRPFVYRLAHERGLTGWVLNGAGRVSIHVEGPGAALDQFATDLMQRAPPLAQPQLTDQNRATPISAASFEIRDSVEGGTPEIHVPPDQFACSECVAELQSPGERRYGYPFINCTQCGPRYTLIQRMPYDRPNTTMATFPLCPDCAAEYRNPLDRRFHAQPLACPVCGPQLSWRQGDLNAEREDALNACVAALKNGLIVAVRGIGGYHLMCDPADDPAVARLRDRKRRPHKPLAVMVAALGHDGLEQARQVARPTPAQGQRLMDPQRPIVLCPLRRDHGLSPAIAPGLDEIGLMLPYSPLHHLLLDAFGAPLVATSGNVSGEPVLTGTDEAESRLAGIADGFLHHNRPIQRPADDPVYREIGGQLRPIRLGRGNAPLELELPAPVRRPTLAVGAFFKNTIALAWDRRIVVSPHIGDLDTRRAREVFVRLIADLQDLYGIHAEALVCDAHPGYPNRRWVAELQLPMASVLHHHAHASAVAGEFGLDEPMLCLCWDGTGFGSDGSIWGAELFIGQPGRWQRTGSLRPFRLPGGDRAARQGWRAAWSLCWESGHDWQTGSRFRSELLEQAWGNGVNAPWCSSAGRLFDAAAALTGLATESSFEGQAAMALEARACQWTGDPDVLPLPVITDANGLACIDWAPLLPMLTDDSQSIERRAACFHSSLAETAAQQVIELAARHGVQRVGLGGGVFQNRLISERLAATLGDAGLTPLLPRALPCNDAGIAFGQIIEATAIQEGEFS